MSVGRRNLWTAFVTLLALAAALRLVHAGWKDSMDFVVYWTAAHNWITGTLSPYAQDPALVKGFVFKYPPWILPIFTPFGLAPFGIAKVLWALVELSCLVYAVRWLIGQGVARRIAVLCAFLFWWMWLAHFLAGQFTIVLMACALWAYPRASSGRLAALALIFTAKVFSGVTLLGIWREFLRRDVLARIAAFMLLLNLPVVLVSAARAQPVLGIYQDWIAAAISGGTELGEWVIRGQMNHGFTAGVLRWLGIDATQSHYDLIIFTLLSALLIPLWYRASRGLSSAEKWAGWIGLGLVVHPLAWHHSFVLAYPLCALALDRAIKCRRRELEAMALLGIVLIGIWIPNVVGMELVTPLENLSQKSWGVVLAAVSLVMAKRHA